jgi:hypothetical protein
LSVYGSPLNRQLAINFMGLNIMFECELFSTGHSPYSGYTIANVNHEYRPEILLHSKVG